MKADIIETVELPEGVTLSYDKATLKVDGSNGSVTRKAILPGIMINSESGTVTIQCKNGTKRQKKIVNTFKAHIKNMARGVTEGHVYKLKICSGHFPMTANVKGQTFELKNFIGEKVPRVTTIPEGVKMKLDGELITLEGSDKEAVGRAAGLLEQLTRRSGFDKRIFQDGIYIIEKDGKTL
jgi:large subunit ribosomal protein L6